MVNGLTFGSEMEAQVLGQNFDIRRYCGIPGNELFVPEVNPVHIIETNSNIANNVNELNRQLYSLLQTLASDVTASGDLFYGGSTVFDAHEEVLPLRYRTTSMSNSLGELFKRVSSQQTIVGIPFGQEEMGFEMMRYFESMAPIVLAMSASSPYAFEQGELVDTGFQSRRIALYNEMFRFLPSDILGVNPASIHDLETYEGHRRTITDLVRKHVDSGHFDVNMVELQNGGHLPINLEPHQSYQWVRIRPDHRNEDTNTAYTLEVRTPDAPLTFDKIQMINELYAGIAYYVQKYGTGNMIFPTSGSNEDLLVASREGLDAQINGQSVRVIIPKILEYATKGLELHGSNNEAEHMNRVVQDILINGNDATYIRHLVEEQSYDVHQLREQMSGMYLESLGV